MSWVYFLNFVSRWVLFLVVSYKAHRERSIGWAYMSISFLLAAIDPERLILEPLGFHLNPEVSYVLDMVNTVFQGVLAFMAAIYIREFEPALGVRLIPLTLGVMAYLWIVITNVGELHLSFFVRTIFPVAVYSVAFLYLGYIIIRYSVSGSIASYIFVLGMTLLALLNLSYSYTVTLPWFRPYGFLLGTLFRVMMAVGAIGVAIWTVSRVQPFLNRGEVVSIVQEPDRDRLLDELKSSPNSILVTRRNIKYLENSLSKSSMVFWITRAVEGELEKDPPVYAISPTKLGILLDLITKALESGYINVYIDSVEYLVLENGFKTTLKFLLNLKDRVLSRNGRMVISIDSGALEPNQVKILRREFEELS